MKCNFPKEIIEIIKKIEDEGFKGFLVGGAIRDCVLGVETADFDIATNAKPKELKTIFKNTIESGKGHNTVSIIKSKYFVDITTFRGKSTATPELSLLKDLEKRDFTINCIAYDPLKKEIIDPFKAVDNLLSNIVVIEAPRNPKERFEEDPLRILRMVSMVMKVKSAGRKWRIEKTTLTTAASMVDSIKYVAVQRVYSELVKIIVSKDVDLYLRLMKNLKILKAIMPELNFSNEDFKLVKSLCKKIELRFAALFLNQSIESVQKSLENLKFPKKSAKKIINLIKYTNYEIERTDFGIRKFMSLAQDELKDTLILKKASRKISHLTEEKLNLFLKRKHPFRIKDLKVNGKDIIKNFNLEPGELVGKILNLLLNEVLIHPEKNNKKELLKMVKTILKNQEIK